MVYFGCIIFYLLLIVVDHDGASGSFVSNISFATRTDIATATEEEYSKVWSWARIESLNLNGIDGETNTVDRSNSYSQGDSFDQLSTISNNRKVNEAMRSRSEMMNSVKYPCNIQKIDLRLSKKGVRSERDISRLPETPVIYVGWPDRNIFLSLLTSKTNMTLSPNGDTEVKLTSSNTFSNGLKKMSLRDYIQYTTSKKNRGAAHMDMNITCGDLGPSAARSNESFYLFGNNYGALWDRVKEIYLIPPCLHCDVCGARTIGIGGYLSGVSFHYHGPGFSEVIVGRKRWFLFPPHQPSADTEYDAFIGNSKNNGAMRDIEYHRQFDPNMTVDRWLLEKYPAYRTRLVPSPVSLKVASATSEIDTAQSQDQDIGHPDINNFNPPWNISDVGQSSNQSDIDSDGSSSCTSCSEERLGDTSDHEYGYDSGLLECVTGPGEMLYFPSSWMHATLNVDEYNVFMSLFLDFQLIPKS